jgi:hypothetical protein
VRRYLITGTLLLLAGIYLLPLAIYMVGQLLAGPYEGSGVVGYIGSIYRAALDGKLAAWSLILSPALIVIVWSGVFRLRRMNRHLVSEKNSAQDPDY